MIFCSRFAYTTATKTLDSVPDYTESKEITDALVGFIQFEEADVEQIASIETKLIKNLKWAARKNDSRTIVLHSFAHLSESKAPEEMAKQVFDSAETRLKASEYEVYQTPYGYFLDLDLQAPGRSLARIFKSF